MIWIQHVIIVFLALIGIAMGLLYLWTGSLLIPMIAHALIDLRALFLLRAVYSRPLDPEDLTPA